MICCTSVADNGGVVTRVSVAKDTFLQLQHTCHKICHWETSRTL